MSKTRKQPTGGKKPAARKAKKKPPQPVKPIDLSRIDPAEPDDRVFDLAVCIVGESDQQFWGMTTRERLRRQFEREGITTFLEQDSLSDRNGPVVLVRADAVIDPPLIPVLAKRPNLLLMSDDEKNAQPVAICINSTRASEAIALLTGEDAPKPGALGLLVRSPATLNADFWKGLRKRETPYARRVDAENCGETEWRMFMGTYKGATDFITKHIWPRPAFYVTRMIAPTAITPNMVTTVGAICVVAAFWLFLEGLYVPGLICAWLMTFLDTVDGKLARTTLTSSKWGDIFDHGIDLVHPPFWYAAWAYGLAHVGLGWSETFLWQVLAVILAGYVLQRIMEGIAIKWLGLEIHIWRPIDTYFRQITARRNPNLAILTLSMLIARPDWGLIAVAVYTVACLVLHGVQLAHAFVVKGREGPLQSWMTRPPEAK